MKDLPISGTLRVKILSIILFIYILLHGNGVIPLFSRATDSGLFSNVSSIGLYLVIILSCLSIILWIVFSFRVIFLFYYKRKDVTWMKITRIIVYAANVLWGFGLVVGFTNTIRFDSNIFIASNYFGFKFLWLTLICDNKITVFFLTFLILQEFQYITENDSLFKFSLLLFVCVCLLWYQF